MAQITKQLINEARSRCAAFRRKEDANLIQVLQQMSGLGDAEFVTQLADLFHYQPMDMAQLNELQPSWGLKVHAVSIRVN